MAKRFLRLEADMICLLGYSTNTIGVSHETDSYLELLIIFRLTLMS